MRILHVVTGLGIGGAEHALCRLLESLREPEFEQHVVALTGANAMSARASRGAVTLIHLGMNPRLPNPLLMLRLRHIVRTIRPDLIQGWMYHGNVAASLANICFRIPLLWGIRQSLYNVDYEKRMTKAVIRLGARLSTGPELIVYNASVSAAQHSRFGYSNTATRVIPNGFDTNHFRPDAYRRARIRAELALSPDMLAIGLVARCHPMKDHGNFLAAAQIFLSRWPNAVFVLVGDGVDDCNVKLMDTVSRLGLNERVRLCGKRQDIASVNAALDIASSSSAWGEAFPNAIGEGMACGLPCVATDVGDARDIVGEAGIVVPSRDPEALCNAWMQLAQLGSTARRRLGTRARRRIIEHYELHAMSRRYAALYQEFKVN